MNKFFAAILGAALVGFSAGASAAIDETIRVKETIEINAPADKVWAIVGDFGKIESWHPAVAKTEITGGNKDEAGATRALTFKDGGGVKETLTARDNAGMTMKYDITEGTLPIREFSGTLTVTANGDKTTVLWKSMFKRQDPANPPAAGKDDQTAKDTIIGIFKTGLENLKKVAEQ